MISLSLVLSILDRSLELALLIAKDIPPEARAKFWERHDDRMEWLHGIARRLTLPEKDVSGNLMDGP